MKAEPKTAPVVMDESSLKAASLLRLPAVKARTAMGRTMLYDLMRTGQFPKPVKVGGASAWVDVEITKWMESLVASRNAQV